MPESFRFSMIFNLISACRSGCPWPAMFRVTQSSATICTMRCCEPRHGQTSYTASPRAWMRRSFVKLSILTYAETVMQGSWEIGSCVTTTSCSPLRLMNGITDYARMLIALRVAAHRAEERGNRENCSSALGVAFPKSCRTPGRVVCRGAEFRLKCPRN